MFDSGVPSFLPILHQGVGSANGRILTIGSTSASSSTQSWMKANITTRSHSKKPIPRASAISLSWTLRRLISRETWWNFEINFQLRINFYVPSSHTASKSRESLEKSVCKIGNTQRSSHKHTTGRRYNHHTTTKVKERFRLYVAVASQNYHKGKF